MPQNCVDYATKIVSDLKAFFFAVFSSYPHALFNMMIIEQEYYESRVKVRTGELGNFPLHSEV